MTPLEFFTKARDWVRKSKVLIRGTLTDSKGRHCAMGSAFVEGLPRGNYRPLNFMALTVEKANDDFKGSMKARRDFMLKWLNKKIREMKKVA
jgi:hypothetical protein